jgi:hypothetical protein
MNDEVFLSVRLSKSGKAILIYDTHGLCYMTSVAYMKMLIDGKARNSMIPAKLMSPVPTTHFNKTYSETWNPNKIVDVPGDPLDVNTMIERNNNRPKVKGDW